MDEYQGGEATFVLLDLVISDELGFLRDSNRINDAITRARDGLIVIGNSRGMERGYGTQKSKRGHGRRDRRPLLELVDNFKTTDQVSTVSGRDLLDETGNEDVEAIDYTATMPVYANVDRDEYPEGEEIQNGRGTTTAATMESGRADPSEGSQWMDEGDVGVAGEGWGDG